jgi:hypothetical protein
MSKCQLHKSIHNFLLWDHSIHDVLNLASGVSSLIGIWVRSYDAPIKFESFIHVLRLVVHVISRRVLLPCFCKYSVVYDVQSSGLTANVRSQSLGCKYPSYKNIGVLIRYLYLLDNQNTCQSFNSWFFIPHHSDLYTETGLKVMTSKYKWAQKKGHI